MIPLHRLSVHHSLVGVRVLVQRYRRIHPNRIIVGYRGVVFAATLPVTVHQRKPA